MISKDYLKSVRFNSKIMMAIFMLSLSNLTYASLARTSQKAARSAYRFASSQPTFFELASSSIPQAPEFIVIPQENVIQAPVKLIASKPQPTLLSSKSLEPSWPMSPQQEQEINDSVRSYAQGRYDNAIKRNQESKIHFDTIEKSRERRTQMMIDDISKIEKNNKFEHELQKIALFFGLPSFASLFLIIGLMTL